VTKVDYKDLVEAGRATPFGVDWPGRQCLAKTQRRPGQSGPKGVALPASISGRWLTEFTVLLRH